MILRVFISSVQKEFACERESLRRLMADNVFLRKFFTSFVFEHDVVATDRRLDELYLSALSKCDLCIALIGRDYGYADNEGVSATAREYEEATRLGIPRLVFVKNMPDSDRDTRELAFLKRISPELFRPTFSNSAELCDAVTSALAQLLEDRQADISDELLVETTLNDGTMADYYELRDILTPQRMAKVFFSAVGRKQNNYYPEIRHFFSLLLKPYA